MNLNGCPTCDRHGPERPGEDQLLELHRACHDLWRDLTEPLAHLLRKKPPNDRPLRRS